MATTFKNLSTSDVVSTRTLLHEAIPLTGTLFSGTYGTWPSDNNIKNYSHGMFQSVYDYPYLSSSANHIVDMTFGYAASSPLSGTSSAHIQVGKKINIYNQMAQMLVGFDSTGSIMQFDADGDIAGGGTKFAETFIFNFSRLLTKDEIKKGSFSMSFMTGAAPTVASGTLLTLSDTDAQNDYRINSPAGEYGILYSGSASRGLVYYQAGIAIVAQTVFNTAAFSSGSTGILTRGATLSGSTIENITNTLRARISNITFNNTTELNSTIYFCRAAHNDFNYSSNPTYLSSSKMVVKNTSTDMPVSYITTVGLYSGDNELMAVAKVSEPLKKDPTNELTLRVRLDY